MNRLLTVFICAVWICMSSCSDAGRANPDVELLSSMGSKFRLENEKIAQELHNKLKTDSVDVTAMLGLAEMNVFRYIFGLSSREETMPQALAATKQAWQIDSLSCKSITLNGIMHFLDWNWAEARRAFEMAINTDPLDPAVRHWYSLLLCATTGRFDLAMLQSDTIMELDPSGDYQIGRGSLLYFARRNTELRDLMLETIAQDPSVPWGYDWLGMAYIELEDYDKSIKTYEKAFTLSDGLVEVGGGLGHALGMAGMYKPAKFMADFYTDAAQEKYLPPVQRAFIHIGIGEHDQALDLLEQAYREKSWFIIFIQIEPWYDPIRQDPRFEALVQQMRFPIRVSQH
ncbi:MAG: tetratricopeptide repeat protein [Saprospiraceae bacterium]|nr:tetratricopeptide repeat protein [Saprospiraceae bacterium]